MIYGCSWRNFDHFRAAVLVEFRAWRNCRERVYSLIQSICSFVLNVWAIKSKIMKRVRCFCYCKQEICSNAHSPAIAESMQRNTITRLLSDEGRHIFVIIQCNTLYILLVTLWCHDARCVKSRTQIYWCRRLVCACMCVCVHRTRRRCIVGY